MATPGTIRQIVITDVETTDGTVAVADIGVSGTVYVDDPGNTPYPGLAIDLGTTDVASVTSMLANPAADLYTLATTGSLP